MKTSSWNRIVASAVIASLVATPALAKSADTLQDLVGAHAAGGETQLRSRGFEHVSTTEDGNRKLAYWWNGNRNDCIEVRTFDGRYTAIADVAASDCGKKSGVSGAAVTAGVIGAAVLGAILLSRKDRNKGTANDSGYQHDTQQVEVYNLQSGSLRIFDTPSTSANVRGEVGAGTLLRNYGCDTYNGESWCEVATLDNRTRGWARDRYLRPSYGAGHYPEYGDHRGDLVQVYGVSNALTITSDPSRNSYVVGQVNAGTTLRREGCEMANGEQWCRVSTLDGRMHGWARERYLRPTGTAGQLPEYGGAGDLVEVQGASGALKILAGPSRKEAIVGRVNRGTTLRKSACEYANGEQWCRVSTLDGRISGWARERYLRPTSGGGNYPGSPGYGGGMMGSISGISGMDAVRAIDELRARGFENVDAFSSGLATYGIYYYRPSRLCVQTTADNRRILDIRDIGSHPRCR